MPSFADLDVDLECPSCGCYLTNLVRFQWGKVPCRYSIGDRIRWIKKRDGTVVAPFVLVERASNWNCGNPTYEDLIVLDSFLYDPNIESRCRGCSMAIEGIGVSIRRGVIEDAEVLSHGRLLKMVGEERPFPDIIVVKEDGSLWPRRDWIDPPLRTR